MPRMPALSVQELRERIDSLPRCRLAVMPTGLQPAPRLAAHLGMESLFIKRDDLTGVALGGNKTRGLEFIIGRALAEGCDVLVAGGGTEQSNHAVQCTACANKAGLDSVIILQKRPDARASGNRLLAEVLGARIVWADSDPLITDRLAAAGRMHEVERALAAAGRRPFVLESSAHPLSVVGYVAAAAELYEQLGETNRQARIYITSEGAALGGLVLGARLLAAPWEIIGLDWRPSVPESMPLLRSIIEQAASLLDVENPVRPADLVVSSSGGPAYGVGTAESWDAIRTAATVEGLLLDPVYTGKGFAAAADDMGRRPPAAGSSVVFVHTGGVAALFAYEAELRRHVIGGGGGPRRPESW